MDEIKKLVTYLTSLVAIIGTLIGLFLALPIGDPTTVITYLGIGSATLVAFIKFLKDLNEIIDGIEVCED
jgi:hypothetical protein